MDIDKLDHKIKSYFDDEADTYDTGKAGQFSRDIGKYMINVIRSVDFQEFLDIGCGTGRLAEQILDLKPQVKACAIDFSPRMIEIARLRLPKRVDVRLSDVRQLSRWCDEESFELIIGNDILRYISEPEKLAREVYKALKDGGRFVLCEASPVNALKNMRNLFSKDIAQKPMVEEDIRDILTDAGFYIVNYTKLDDGICLITGHKRA